MSIGLWRAQQSQSRHAFCHTELPGQDENQEYEVRITKQESLMIYSIDAIEVVVVVVEIKIESKLKMN